jgi:cellulose synthase/poly-beta-1,6-N-acetylglucosamine synthase-like glycosyltransferase
MDADWPHIAVLIPTYRRREDLRRCLQAVRQQLRPAHQIVVVLRPDDEEAQQAVNDSGASADVTLAFVSVPGQIAALNAGLRAVRTDVVAFTDDDAAPRPDWLERIAAHFRGDLSLGGLGGRDWIHQHGRLESGSERVVGVITWYGRLIGNHHLGAGPSREVDVLKGANMSFRVSALEGIRFDERLRGSGAQVFNELGVCLAVKKRGWRIVYDPTLAVDHYPAVRHDEDKRNFFSRAAIGHAAYNETLTLSEHLPRQRRIVFLLWALIVGNRAAPGLMNWARLLVIERRTATARFVATIEGRFSAWAASRRQ